MEKNVVVISTSLRAGSNSDLLAEEFARGAKDGGNKVEKISLLGKKIEFCRGCLSCQDTKKCVIDDDACEIVEKMRLADVIVFATPIYYYEMCGQMKTLLDRGNPLYANNYKFRNIYMLYTATEDDEISMKRAVNGLDGWIECFEDAKLSGTIFCGGVTNPLDIKGNNKLVEAYELGKKV